MDDDIMKKKKKERQVLMPYTWYEKTAGDMVERDYYVKKEWFPVLRH